MKGLLYISIPRPGLKRGGGVALAADPSLFTLSKLNVPIPHQLEVSWGLLKPRQVTGSITKILCCAFYSPPKSKKKTKLIEHISSTLQDLLLDHPGAGIIIAGDRNDLTEKRLLAIEPSLRQIVGIPTLGRKVLDVILTNLSRFFNEPVTVSPVPVDDISKGVPSDHLGVMVTPIQNATLSQPRLTRTIVFRPMPESKINSFGEEICNVSWDFLKPTLSSTELTKLFQMKISGMIDHHFPLNTMKITNYDEPWITNQLKKLKRIRMREYCTHGKSKKYNELKAKFDLKQVEAVDHYTKKIINEVTDGTRSSSYKALRKLGVRKGDTKDDLFTLPNHVQQNLTEEQSVERIADYFSNISQEFEPLMLDKLPPNIRNSILEAKDDTRIPKLEPYEVYYKILRAKKPNSVIKGDIPKRIVQLFSPELASPLATIYNKISSSFEYPRQWVKESQIPIPKVFPPKSEDDLRPISKTFFLSKVYESFIGEWLLSIIKPYMDPGQYGTKGSLLFITFSNFCTSSILLLT